MLHRLFTGSFVAGEGSYPLAMTGDEGDPFAAPRLCPGPDEPDPQSGVPTLGELHRCAALFRTIASEAALSGCGGDAAEIGVRFAPFSEG